MRKSRRIMKKAALVILLRVALLVAVAASAALFVDYQHAGDPAFCGVGSGCLKVRLSPFSHIGPVGLPTVGLAAYVGLFAFALFLRTRVQAAIVAGITGAGALIAIGLIAAQGLVVKAFCKWCVMVDGGAIAAAACAIGLWLALKDEDVEVTPIRGDEGTADHPYRAPVRLEASWRALDAFQRPAVQVAWMAAALVALAAPFLWGAYPVIPTLPASIAALQVPGKVTIVSFTDFECPFCRALHPTIDALVEAHPDRVAVVRKMMPLAGHRGAMPAALTFACTPDELKPRMAKALYDVEESELTPEGTLAVAEKVGADRDKLAACVEGPDVRALIEQDVALFKELDTKAVPLTYVGPRVILGANDDRVREAVELGLESGRPELPLWSMFAAIGAMLVTAVAVSGAGLAASKREAPAPAA